jgi:hypothetical protein
MQPFPHHSSIAAKAHAEGDVSLEGERLPAIPSAPPIEFGGPGDQARRLLTKAEETCLVTNSLKVRPQLESSVEFEGA